MAKLSTLNGTLTTLVAGVEKIITEVAKLKEQLSDVDIPAEAEATLLRLGTLVQQLDDINPDTP